MALVTDSFCERCGTRYVFQAPPSRALSMKSARVLARGLRNFVMNDGQSLEDSMQAAQHEDSSADSSRLTQAFHRAFNFCMSCRQYACEACWNPKAGACLTCAPLSTSAPSPEREHLIARTPVIRLDIDLAEPRPDEPPAPQALQAPHDETAAFDAGRLPSMPTVQAEPIEPAWPQVDRMAPESETTSQAADPSFFDFEAEPLKPAARSPEWLLRRGSADGETVARQNQDGWNLWPITDPLAPEATLTPEELSLVEAHLFRTDAGAEVEPEPTPEAMPQPAAAEPVLPVAAEHLEAPIVQPVAATPSLPEPGVVPQPVPAPLAGFAVEGFAPIKDATDQPPLPLALMAQRGTPSNGVWPHPTLWVDRPNKSSCFSFDDDVTASESAFADEFASPTYEAASVIEAEVPAGPVAAEPAEAVAEAEAAFVAEPEPAFVAEPAIVAEPEPAFVAEAEPAADAVAEPEPAFVAEPEPAFTVEPAPAIEAEPAVVVEPEPAVVAEPEPAFVAEPEPVPSQPIVLREIPVGVAWQQRLMAANAAARFAPEPVATPAAPQPVASQPVVQQPEFAAQPPAVQPAPAPAPAPIVPSEPLPTPAAPVNAEQPNQGWPPLGAQWPAPLPQGPVWPAPQGVAAPAAVLTAKAAATTEMWTQSSQQVMNRGTVRVCHHCSLPLSTHARFCRRCGTSQD